MTHCPHDKENNLKKHNSDHVIPLAWNSNGLFQNNQNSLYLSTDMDPLITFGSSPHTIQPFFHFALFIPAFCAYLRLSACGSLSACNVLHPGLHRLAHSHHSKFRWNVPWPYAKETIFSSFHLKFCIILFQSHIRVVLYIYFLTFIHLPLSIFSHWNLVTQ